MWRRMTELLALASLIAPTDLISQSTEREALSLALAHSRTVVVEGKIQVSSDSVPAGQESLVQSAAVSVGFSFGPLLEVAREVPTGGYCSSGGDFRGFVTVLEIDVVDLNTMVVILETALLYAHVCRMYLQVDRIEMVRDVQSGRWKILTITRLSET